jgi:hypothetical protein
VTSAVRLARLRWWPAGLAWGLWVLVVLGLAAGFWLEVLLRRSGRADPLDTAVAPTVATVSAATVGAVLAGRRPRHPVGWLLLACGLSLSAAGVAGGYAPYGLQVRPGALPAAAWVALYYPATALTPLALLSLVLLLTPTGSPPSPGWRWWAWLMAGALAVLVLAMPLAPRPPEERYQAVDNPFDLRPFGGALLLANRALLAVTVLGVLVGAGSLVVRFRRARGVERQQLRWVVLAAALTGVGMLASVVLVAAGNESLVGWVSGVCVVVLPVAVGAAVLRYRLFDLDRIISRTLAYGLLTVRLGLGYAGVVLGLGRLLPRAPVWWWPRRPWRWRRCSSRPAAASRPRWTGGSTGDTRTPLRRSRRSAPGCASRSTWTRWPPSCWPWSSRRCTRPERRCGCGHRMHRRPRLVPSWPAAHLTRGSKVKRATLFRTTHTSAMR